MTRSKPSVLVVFADQLRGRDLGCMGNDEVDTPEIDRFAADGVVARRCFANTPVCTPNRGTLLTGQLPHVHGALGNDLPLPPTDSGIGQLTRDAGYRTGYIGKWHLDGVPRDKFTPPGERRHGFDFWAAFNCSHDYLNPRYYRDTPALVTPEGYEPEVQTDLAVDFLADVPEDDPFCLFLSWGPPHDPYHAVPDRYRDQVDPAGLKLAPNVVEDAANPVATGLTTRRTLADYYAAINALDDQFGRLMRTLDELGRRDDTIVVFTSDHGDMLWAHGWMKKQLPHEESVHVPLLVRWPDGLPSGTRVDDLVSTVDLAPTLLAAAGLDVPETMDGRNVLPALRGEDRDPDRAVFLANHMVLDEARRQRVPEWRGIRTDRYTYAETVGRTPWLLFDNHADPWQMTNLVGDAPHASVQTDLAERLHGLLDEIGDPFLDSEGMVEHFGLDGVWNERVAWRGAVSATPR